jgi:hypothetical protein
MKNSLINSKRKFVVVTVFLLLLFASFAQTIGVKPAAASNASIIWRSTGGSDWYAGTDWWNENTVAYDVCHYIESLYSTNRAYNRLNLYEDSQMTFANIKTVTGQCSAYDYTTVFNYAHGGYGTINGRLGMGPFQIYDVPITHYRYYAYNGDNVYDNDLYPYAGGNSGAHHFAFQYTCAQANIVGYEDEGWYHEDENNGYISYYTGTGAVGFSYAWTGKDNTMLSSNGYTSPDNGGYCYIGFVDWSKPLCAIANPTTGATYGDFVKIFYEKLLINNLSINAALNAASEEIWGTNISFGASVLNTGYTDNLPSFGPWAGKMRVFGNGNNGIP